MESWFRDHNIKSFYTVQQTDSFSYGVQNMINLTGLGKLCPNMVLMGLQSNRNDNISSDEYFKTLTLCLEKKMAVGVLKLPNGCDYSGNVASEETFVEEVPNSTESKKSKKEKKTVAVYRDANGKPLPKSVVDEIQQFTGVKRSGTIDVYWLYDDGGLTLLLPYILKTRKQFASCKLRVFSLTNRPEDLNQSTIGLSNMLAKFRINYSEVEIIPDITKKALPETKAQFEEILKVTSFFYNNFCNILSVF